MKHLLKFKLYESHGDETINPNLVFDWIEYDTERDNPIHSSIPASITMEKLKNLQEKNPTLLAEMEKAGTYIAHIKSGGGFSRIVTKSFSPLRIDYAQFDNKYRKITEINDVSPDSDFKVLSKGINLASRRFS